jgi:spore coat polysaccharide biosynthesis protein SpsF
LSIGELKIKLRSSKSSNNLYTNIGIIIQARMTSTRLPGKVLMEAAGLPMLSWQLKRLKLAGIPIYLATTSNNADKPLVNWALENDIQFYRGDEYDVLSRYFFFAKKLGLKTIIRVTSDCPLIDGNLLKRCLDEYLSFENDRLYLCNSSETYPRGFDFEIFSWNLLKEANHLAVKEHEREHVTPYMYSSNRNDVCVIKKQLQENKSKLRFTLDYIEDFTLLKLLIEVYHAHDYSFEKIIELVEKHQDLKLINANIEQSLL